MINTIRTASTLCLVAVLAGCGGGGGGSSSPPPATVQPPPAPVATIAINGSVMLGPVADIRVRVRGVDGQQLGTSRLTDADGNFGPIDIPEDYEGSAPAGGERDRHHSIPVR